MSRYLGPIWKKSRALSFSLLGSKKEFRKRSTFPGQHGDKKRRFSSYSLQNREKQKLLYLYGIRENQLHNLIIKLKNKEGNIEDNLLANLSSTLVNLVFLSGLVNTNRFARQLVSHGHFLVDGKKVKSPSFHVKIGSIISLRKEEKIRENKIIKGILEQVVKSPSHIHFDREKLTITYLKKPSSWIDGINIPLIIEWYSRKK